MSTRRFVLTLLAAMAATAALVSPACATGRLVDMQIVDRSRSETLPAWAARGSTWIAGRPGDRYAVRLTNRSAGRVLVVLSVDGVNAVSGETAAVGQTGYVLGPWASAEITGWRKSESEAAAFYFTSLPDSYAARTDRPGNVGVIGAAVFRERQSLPAQLPYEAPPLAGERPTPASRGEAESRMQPSPAAPAATDEAGNDMRSSNAPMAAAAPSARRERDSFAKADKLGTGHGEREYSPTTQTTFERASTRPAEIVQVRYDSYANLVASGIIARPRPYDSAQAFPSFVPDPR